MKKGFTLVELLAVIAILALLAIITLPNIFKMFKKSKKDTFVSEANILYSAVEKEYLNDTFNTSNRRVFIKSPTSDCSNELPVNVRDDLYYYIEVNGTGNVTKFYMYDKEYQYSDENGSTIKTTISSDEVEDLSNNQLEKVNIDCNKIVFTANNTSTQDNDYTFLARSTLVNKKIKTLANPEASSVGYITVDENIEAIKRSQTPPTTENMQSNNIISASDSSKPVYAWYDGDTKTIYYYTEASQILLDKNVFNMFYNFTKLKDISGLSDFDTRNTTSMTYMFYNDYSLEDLSPISGWNTKRVTNMTAMFAGSPSNYMSINSLRPLSNWNTSSLTSVYATFQDNGGYTSLEGLENWDTSKVTNMQWAFIRNKNLTTLHGIENWNTSNVTNMTGMFHGCNGLQDASAIENWDVSNVLTMNNMFNISGEMNPDYSSLSSLNLSRWNMAKVQNYEWWVESLRFVSMEVTIRSTQVSSYRGMFQDAANNCCDANHENCTCQIVVNYTRDTETLVDKMIATKSQYGNVVKGRLVE